MLSRNRKRMLLQVLAQVSSSGLFSNNSSILNLGNRIATWLTYVRQINIDNKEKTHVFLLDERCWTRWCHSISCYRWLSQTEKRKRSILVQSLCIWRRFVNLFSFCSIIVCLFVGDYNTRHAACPVLIGNKWVANKWIHERGQEFRRPCSLDPMAWKILNRLFCVVETN